MEKIENNPGTRFLLLATPEQTIEPAFNELIAALARHVQRVVLDEDPDRESAVRQEGVYKGQSWIRDNNCKFTILTATAPVRPDDGLSRTTRLASCEAFARHYLGADDDLYIEHYAEACADKPNYELLLTPVVERQTDAYQIVCEQLAQLTGDVFVLVNQVSLVEDLAVYVRRTRGESEKLLRMTGISTGYQISEQQEVDTLHHWKDYRVY